MTITTLAAGRSASVSLPIDQSMTFLSSSGSASVVIDHGGNIVLLERTGPFSIVTGPYSAIATVTITCNSGSVTFETPASATLTTTDVATAIAAGLMSAADKVKVDALVLPVPNSSLSDVETATIKGRSTAGTGDPEDLTVSQVKTLLSLENVDNTSNTTERAATATLTNKTLSAPVLSGTVSGTATVSAALTFSTMPTLPADATTALQPCTKQQLDAVASGTSGRTSVRVGTTANITIATALNNGDTLNGVVLATNDLVLVAHQTAPAENGVYVVSASPARDTAYDTYNEHVGKLIVQQEGTSNSGRIWFCNALTGGTIDVTAITFTLLNTAGELLQANNLSDVASAATARTNLGIGSVDNTSDAAKPVSTATQTALDLKANKSLTWNARTGSYTLVLGDAGEAVEMNVASANNLTVPPNSSVAFPTGTAIMLYQAGAGQTTVVAGSGVTIRVQAAAALKLRGQYALASLVKRSTDVWVLGGDLEVV